MDIGRIIQSPICEVHMAGFSSTTAQLQSAGWQLSIGEDPAYNSMRLAIKHPIGLYGMSNSVSYRQIEYVAMEVNRYRNSFGGEAPRLPVFDICSITSNMYAKIALSSSFKFQSFDAFPYIEDAGEEQHIEDVAMFRPIDKEKEIVIVKEMEDDVVKLLSRITELQRPKQDEIRKRMKYRNQDGFQKADNQLGNLL